LTTRILKAWEQNKQSISSIIFCPGNFPKWWFFHLSPWSVHSLSILGSLFHFYNNWRNSPQKMKSKIN
jgi:hypothetical protein